MVVNDLLDDCLSDLNSALAIVDSLGATSKVVPYLNKYAVIKACGSIEIAFKSIVTDHCEKQASKQLKNFINLRVRESSMNPTYENICSLLKSFDLDWSSTFKKQVGDHVDKDQILTAIKSLVDSRNDFAHGGNPTVAISDAIQYFEQARKLLAILDNVVV